MSLLFWALTLGVVGKVMLAIGILKVHYVMAQERSIGERVIHSFRYEMVVTLIGVFLIITGYLCELYFYNGANLLTCSEAHCSATLLNAIAP